MPFLTQDLEDMRVGWQKVADRYHMTIYVFRTEDTYHAFSNKSQGVGNFEFALEPTTEVVKEVAQHGRYEIAAAARV